MHFAPTSLAHSLTLWCPPPPARLLGWLGCYQSCEEDPSAIIRFPEARQRGNRA